jgi:hypothetical protein
MKRCTLLALTGVPLAGILCVIDTGIDAGIDYSGRLVKIVRQKLSTSLCR